MTKDLIDDIAPPIDIDLPNALQDQKFRSKFFLAESSALIAEQLIDLRRRRDLSQKQVAEITGTRQSAISRAEQADYQNWSFNTLRSIADALDARIRVLIQPSEDILHEYEYIQSNVNYIDQKNDTPSPSKRSSAWNDFFPMGRYSGPSINDNEFIPRDPEITEQTKRGRINLREVNPQERERLVG